ncbi:MAG: dihydrolipoyllysine-residue acetyltransferase [Gallionellales bacterium 35-53-114]|jgi:pyruvate dehydrogenase E2 component (dihydrolipoamide acetyltransferase)|nr:MAG: dihydrolipoyllysine-residue acetyltransferase [Gallionellales bacterium 35-53-114]OYZ64464.1 MAG: dihydrolipoyllysine-residue acetyltransferase [Gallionellales bacterium 24-53-125]OZB10232.1 MAG: dihydrolipoyllysine-residue acetyltransferase [Gallionellales bacterium 39-52-133]HQS56823.1 dihydrolipoyllysine-residue acetyltransferase [Gallionellaceae bacterium]HQS75393.1 dihydrolipoyllysine-residue acetyltransferase [Gallionellaceae bacterium]
MAEMKQVLVPDIGNYKDVPVIEVMVKAGDSVKAEQSLLTLETDKATMDVPAPFDGVVKEVKVKVGDTISEGSLIFVLETSASAAPAKAAAPAPAPADAPAKVTAVAAVAAVATPAPAPASVAAPVTSGGKAHASPSIRAFARELGVELSQVKGTAVKGRISKDDVQNFVKAAMSQPRGAAGGTGGMQVLAMPVVDFARFGAVESQPLSRIKKISGANLHRNWVTIPHVTQFDEADISEMEAFRKQIGAEYAKQDIKITPLVFMLKAVVAALQKFPEFNASLDASGENLILKKYYHIGVAVDTPNGLMVPVLRDVDKKGLVQLAKELGEISAKARALKISAADMQGGCFSISSLGGIGGTAFTPIINAPEVAILGVSKASMKPVYQNGEFVPRLMLPLSLSYDHRVIDGASGARFTQYLAQVLTDIRRLAL